MIVVLTLLTVACGSSSDSDSSSSSSNLSSSSSNKTVFVWDDWSNNDDIEFQATETLDDASGFATLDGGDFTPDQSSNARMIETGGSTTSYSTDASDNTNFIGQSYNESYYIDFEITLGDTYTALSEFQFDAYAYNNGDPQLNWTLSVEPTNLTSTNVLEEGVFPYSEITLGTVDRQAMSTDTNEWQTLTFDLSSLSDNDVGPSGTVRLRLYVWGGTSNSVETDLTGIDNVVITAYEPDSLEEERPELGERADWMRGTWGINWKPANYYNGYIELVNIDDFMDQIVDLSSLSYIQLHLNGSNVYSPMHTAPNDILESLWGDEAVDDDSFITGDTTNLIVPRVVSGLDPFGDWLEAVKDAGLKTQVYINSSNMLYRTGSDNPDVFPDITERWYAYCDESEAVQAFLDSKPYYRSDDYPDREYMFCYAEFILRDYAKNYGDLIDAWIFDSASYMNSNGDDESTGTLSDQRIYQAFAEAIRAGNRDVAASFNNGTGSVKEAWSPIQRPTLFDDYSFGHPFGGGDYIGGEPDTDNYGPGDEDVYETDYMYDKNFRIIEFMAATDGNVFDLGETLDYFDIKFYDHFDWDDNVVGHFDPPMATLSWNSGSTAALTDEHFTLWNTSAVNGGGAISWGGPLNGKKANQSNRNFTLTTWALEQLTVMDTSVAALKSSD